MVVVEDKYVRIVLVHEPSLHPFPYKVLQDAAVGHIVKTLLLGGVHGREVAPNAPESGFVGPKKRIETANLIKWIPHGRQKFHVAAPSYRQDGPPARIRVVRDLCATKVRMG